MEQAVNVLEQCVGYDNFIAQAFCEGGPTMYAIAAVGVITAFIIVERFYKLSKIVIDKRALNENLTTLLLRGDLKQAITYCESRPTPLTNTLKAGLVQVLNKRPDEEVQVAMDAAVLRETPQVEGLTPFLAVFGNVAVLIGLFGTIAGLIKSFRGVAKADQTTKAAILSSGISEALNCTAFGLMVAIIAIITYGYFQLKINRAINDMLESSMNMMNLVVSNRDKMKY